MEVELLAQIHQELTAIGPHLVVEVEVKMAVVELVVTARAVVELMEAAAR
jgi:hypothetical protein